MATIPTPSFYYNLDLELDPETCFLKVQGSLRYTPPAGGLERVCFLLNRQLEVTALGGPLVAGHTFHKDRRPPVPFIYETGELELELSRGLAAGESLDLEFAYQGRVTDWPEYCPNVIRPDWVELGIYLPWYPLIWDPAQRVTFRLRVHCPPGFRLAGYGEFRRVGDAWECERLIPAQEITVLGSPGLRCRRFETNGYFVNIHASALQPETVLRMGEDALNTLSLLSDWFGPLEFSGFNLIQTRRQEGGGYGRRGLVVLGDLTDRDYRDQWEVYLRYLAHEIAHAWWYGAQAESWEDWLNESFAEISALLVVGELAGAPAYRARLDKKRERSRGTIPLWGFDRSDQSSPASQEQCQILLYGKGAVFLHDLMERIGRDDFLGLCRQFLSAEERSTACLLALIETRHGADIRDWFETKLRKE